MSIFRRLAARIKSAAFTESGTCISKLSSHTNTQAIQRQLFAHYRQLKNNTSDLPQFRDTGFRIFSQSDEDGLLLYIFSLLGFTNKILVDVACGTPLGANSTNLICNWGFTGLLVEGNREHAETTKRFYSAHPDTCIFPPTVQCAWLTAENINAIMQDNDIAGEIDLFSLDVDGVDYWILKNLTSVRPRVIIAEAITFWGKQRSVTVPYDPRFNRFDVHPDFMGASIPALVKLSREKGYRLVACNRFGYNIIFVRNDLGADVLPEIQIDECFQLLPPELKRKREERLNSVNNFNWVDV